MWDKIIGTLPVVTRRSTVALNEKQNRAIISRNNLYRDALVKRQDKINELSLELFNLNNTYKQNAVALNEMYARAWEAEEQVKDLQDKVLRQEQNFTDSTESDQNYIRVLEDQAKLLLKPRTLFQRLVYLFTGK